MSFSFLWDTLRDYSNGWAEPDYVSTQPRYCCLSLKVVGASEGILGFLLQGLGKRDSAGCSRLDDKQSCMHFVG
jgi:hypothetical protein